MSTPLDAFLDRLGHLSVDDLSVLAIAESDPVARRELLERAEAAAARAGRGDEPATARRAAREMLFGAFARRAYDPTWFGLNWGRSLGRADDRARLVAAVEDAAVAAALADLLPSDDVAALSEPFELAASMAGTAPSANPTAGDSTGRRGLVVAAFVASAALIGSVGGGFLALAAALAARRRR